MLDFGWSELLLILIVSILVIGPKQIPDVLYAFGRIVRRLQYVRFALSKQFDDFMEKSDLHEMRKISDHVQTSIHHEVEDDLDLHEAASHKETAKEKEPVKEPPVKEEGTNDRPA